MGLHEKGKKKGFSEGMQRRAAHINKIFFDTVTQIIGNGELDIYIDVTKVGAPFLNYRKVQILRRKTNFGPF